MLFEQVQRFILAKKYFGFRCTLTQQSASRNTSETWVTWGAFHLHGIPGNSGWKIKWYIPFHLERFRN